MTIRSKKRSMSRESVKSGFDSPEYSDSDAEEVYENGIGGSSALLYSPSYQKTSS
jgi:hypothetical protein